MLTVVFKRYIINSKFQKMTKHSIRGRLYNGEVTTQLNSYKLRLSLAIEHKISTIAIRNCLELAFYLRKNLFQQNHHFSGDPFPFDLEESSA